VEQHACAVIERKLALGVPEDPVPMAEQGKDEFLQRGWPSKASVKCEQKFTETLIVG
jgi:hypothetical protein